MIRSRLVALLVLAAVIAACGTSGPTSRVQASPTRNVAPGGSDQPAPAGPSGKPTKAPGTQSGPPTETAKPGESTGPSAEPSPVVLDGRRRVHRHPGEQGVLRDVRGSG